MTIGYAAAVKTARLDVVLAAIDAGAGAGKLKIYDGTRPAAAGGSLSGNTLLGTVTLNNPAGVVSGSTLTIDNSPVPEDASADATGTPTWVRITDSDDNFVLDASAAVGSGDFNFTSALTATQPIRWTSGVITGGN